LQFSLIELTPCGVQATAIFHLFPTQPMTNKKEMLTTLNLAEALLTRITEPNYKQLHGVDSISNDIEPELVKLYAALTGFISEFDSQIPNS